YCTFDSLISLRIAVHFGGKFSEHSAGPLEKQQRERRIKGGFLLSSWLMPLSRSRAGGALFPCRQARQRVHILHQYSLSTDLHDAQRLPLAEEPAHGEQRRTRQLRQFRARQRNLEISCAGTCDLIRQSNQLTAQPPPHPLTG